MRIVIGADHGGFELKEDLKKWLVGLKHEVVDIGASALVKDDDFVDYAELVAEEVAGADPSASFGDAQDKGSGQVFGILFCRNGFGMMIAANRFNGVRCGEAFNLEAVKRGRSDDDINCLSVPSDYLTEGEVKKMIEVFLKTEFSGEERYKRRLWKLEMLNSSGGCCGGGCGGECGSC